ncbi:MAG TPA: rRNA maturation RNase YbeY [Trichormus sp.]|jgi:probable rRNA maturation factor
MEVTILNRQRRVCVELPELDLMVETLSQSLFRNLEAAPAKWLERKSLRAMQANGTLSLVLVSNQKIRQLNKQWREKDYATDVLSFPLAVDENRQILPAPPGESWELGEVVLSVEKTAEQAAEYGHSFQREFAFLYVHGLLHVLGFDHITKAQEKDMFGRQREILTGAGFSR